MTADSKLTLYTNMCVAALDRPGTSSQAFYLRHYDIRLGAEVLLSRVRNHILDEKLSNASRPPPLLKCLAADFRLVSEITVDTICFARDSSQGFSASWRARIQEGARL